MTGFAINLMVIGGGLFLLLGLAVLVGRVEGRARDEAWCRIADARRLQHRREREFFECLNSAQCRDCPTWRYLRDQLSE